MLRTNILQIFIFALNLEYVSYLECAPLVSVGGGLEVYHNTGVMHHNGLTTYLECTPLIWVGGGLKVYHSTWIMHHNGLTYLECTPLIWVGGGLKVYHNTGVMHHNGLTTSKLQSLVPDTSVDRCTVLILLM